MSIALQPCLRQAVRFGLACAFAGLLPCAAQAAVYVVTTADDAVDANPGDGFCATAAGPGTCSLRAAIQEANAATGGTVISLPAGVYTLSVTTTCAFQFAAPSNYAVYQTVSLCIDRDVSLVGAGAETTIIDANLPPGGLGLTSPVFFVGASAAVDMSGVTVRRGNFSLGSVVGHGGGIRNAGRLVLDGVTVSDNYSSAAGGGIYNTGNLTVLRSKLVRNTALQTGGGIANFAEGGAPPGSVRVQDSLLSLNSASHGGGLATFQGPVILTGSTVSDNTAGQGGGLWNGNFNTMTLTNVTVSGNRANNGGGIVNEFAATMTLDNVTVANNTAQWQFEARGVGGGRGPPPPPPPADNATTTLRNTIIAQNFARENIGPDCYTGRGTLASAGYNLFGDTRDCPTTGNTTGNLTGLDPKLGTLIDNGGPAPTHALADTSPAIDAGSPAAPGSGGTACAAVDQRGFLRPIGARCDMGAFERQSVLSLAKVVPSNGGQAGPVSATITGSGFTAGASVALKRAGEPDIAGQFVTVDPGGSAIGATFDLAGRTPGAWDLVVTLPGGTSVAKAGAFIVETGGAADLWVDVLGVIRRPGRRSTLMVVYGNRGQVDALGVPLTLTLPRGYLAGARLNIQPPPAQPGEVRPPWRDVSPVVAETSLGNFVQVPLFLPVVAAGSTSTFTVGLTLPVDAQDTLMLAAIGSPKLYPGSASDPFIDAAVSGATSYLQLAAGIAVPSSVVPMLRQYAAGQFAQAVADGRSAWAASFGTRPLVYSLGQLQLDLAFYAAPRSTAAAAQASASSMQPRGGGQ